tara:strand:- start:3063 stop:3461 length:399 start_codon:yes stop_codon:yes gene_type:complete
MTTTRTPATYQQIIDSEYMKTHATELAEFGEFNYHFTQAILDELDAWIKYDKNMNELPISPESKKKIREYAERIMKRGGLQALQENYYTMINFCVVTHMAHLPYTAQALYSKVNDLRYLLDGCKGGGDVWRS